MSLQALLKLNLTALPHNQRHGQQSFGHAGDDAAASSTAVVAYQQRLPHVNRHDSLIQHALSCRY